MKKIILFLIFLVFFISFGAVSAEGNFTALQSEIDSSTSSMEIMQDYIYDNSTDYKLTDGIINKNNFTIKGNGHTIDASNQARIFNIHGDNITINDLNIVNAYVKKSGGAIYSKAVLTLNNVTFKNNSAENGGAIYNDFKILNISNCIFINNTAKFGGSIFSTEEVNINDSVFANSTSTYAPAIYAETNLKIINSTFQNLSALQTAGAIAVKGENYTEINNCTFINTKAGKNAGAIFVDTLMYTIRLGVTYIVNSSFINTSGDYGGVIVKLDRNLTIENSKFINSTALYNGGAIYTSWANNHIKNTTIAGSKIVYDDYGVGGALYVDYSNTTIEDSFIINNTNQGIYAYDKKLTVKNTLFSDNGEAIHGVFLKSDLINVTTGNDTFFLNDADYSTIVVGIGKTLTFINNTIDVETLPSRYDSRDWGWLSAVKNQGEMGACWTFASLGALESALIKSTGIEYDFSENNMQNSMLKYSKYGIMQAEEGAFPESALEYIAGWFGVFPTEYDTYDELGKLSPLIATDEDIHVYDAIMIGPRKNATDTEAIKKAIIKCGSVSMGYFHDEINFNEDNTTYYQNQFNFSSHAISFVGWDDNFPASKFRLTPPGNGAWIIKDSYGTEIEEKGFFYISYYDTSILNQYAIGYLLGNTENYTTNYQTDLGGKFSLNKTNGSIISYKNTYCAIGNELISAIGTYFEEGENYTVEIYVNDELKHSQSGTALFTGYHTLKLTSEIPIHTDDNFTAIVNKTSVPILSLSRQHYLENITYINFGNGWRDLALENKTVSLKVLTKYLPIYTNDLVKYYKNASRFEADVGIANETVVFEICDINYTRLSNENGTASIAINLRPGNYTIKTTCNNVSVENNIEVLSTLMAQNLVKYFQNASQFYISLVDGEGNLVSGANITMNINGVFYTRTTNENGTACLNINLEPGEYILTAKDPFTGLEMSYVITVLAVLTGKDLNMTYKDGHVFEATLVDGKGNTLANAAVNFNINGIFYTRYTDSVGIARLNINLMPGEYIITSAYENAVTSNKITITAKED